MKRISVAATLISVVVSTLGLTAPAQAAEPDVTLTVDNPGLNKGNATTTGALVELLGPIPNATNVGTAVVGRIAANYGGVAVKSYQATWYSCPTRGAALNTCEAIAGSGIVNGTADGKSLSYTVGADAVGTYLRFVVNVTNNNNETALDTSPTNSDIAVYPLLPTGGRPTPSGAMIQGTQTNIALKEWTIPAGSTFASRAVTAYSCPQATNGQGAASAWNPAGDGCTDVSSGIASTFATRNATTIAFNIPASTAGRFLVIQDTVGARSTVGNLPTLTAVRSEGIAITTEVTPTPTPTPSPTATADPTPAPSVFRVAVTSKPAVTRGSRLKVVVSTSSARSIGEAKVQLKKRPSARGKATQTLKAVDIVNGTGQSVTKIGSRIAKGDYFLWVTYVDDRTGKITTASSKVKVT